MINESYNCDSIMWLIDLFGTIEILELLINNSETSYVVINLDENKSVMKNVIKSDGLYFKEGHWYIIKNGIKNDSYSNGYQIYKTAHFCQTFAVLMFINKQELLKIGEYSYNIKVAMNYWINILNTDNHISNSIIEEARILGEVYYPNLIIDGTNVKLKDITIPQMIKFLENIKNNSKLFIDC